MKDSPNILGINYGGHDTSACLMINGEIIIRINADKAVNSNKQIIADSDLFILNFAILILQIKLFNGLMLIEITIAMKKYIINS